MGLFGSFSFDKFSRRTSVYAGKPLTFSIAVLIILAWAATGPLFRFSDTWQLVINTGTTIITFLMVFLIQSAQNRDSRAVQLKLDELILKIEQADNRLIDIETLTDEELDELALKYGRLRKRHTPRTAAIEEDAAKQAGKSSRNRTRSNQAKDEMAKAVKDDAKSDSSDRRRRSRRRRRPAASDGQQAT